MAATSRLASVDRQVHSAVNRSTSTMMTVAQASLSQPPPPPSSQQQQQHQLAAQVNSRTTVGQGHQASQSQSQTLLNTELRAQARREKEATRDRKREKTGQQQMQQATAPGGGLPGRERSSSVYSSQPQAGEKKVSPPKTVAKSSAGVESRINVASRPTLSRPNHKSSSSNVNAHEQGIQQVHPTRPPLQTLQSAPPMLQQEKANDEVYLQRHPFTDIVSHIPSPPKGDEAENFDSRQTAYFVKYYYDMVEKCHSWQRYAANLKSKAETLDLENRILKDINHKQEVGIRSLEMEVANLKQATMVHEHERRRAESKLSCYSNGISPANSSGELSNRFLRQATSTSAFQSLEAGIEPVSIPSPPTFGQNGLLPDLNPLGNRIPQQPYCSSNLNIHSSRDGSAEMESGRPPTPTSAVSLPQSLQAILQGQGRPTLEDGRRSRSGHHRMDSSIADMLNQDAAHREASSGPIYEANYQFRTHRQPQLSHLAASHTFPPADITPSAALTVQALAAMNRQDVRQTLASSNSVPQLASQVWERPLSPHRAPSRQMSAEDCGLLSASRSHTTGLLGEQSRSFEGREEYTTEDSQGHISASHSEPVLTSMSGAYKSDDHMDSAPERERDLAAQAMARGGSALSDAATVTGDYLHEIVEQKRRLRKVSQSQQQQLHYLQARIHLTSNASQSSIHSNSGIGSRPSSRMSNTGGTRATKVRSRAGSYTVHDSIPVAKDDVFGMSDSMQSIAPIKRAGTMPLSCVDLNSGQGARCSSRAEIADVAPAKSEKAVQESELSPRLPQEQPSPLLDQDPKGAHRRLYIRLRDELETADLVRFERYVHRYDGLEIGVDGSRGIVNRVRRLLLPEELVRSKLIYPDKYRLRKELAREFERIVREDALPKGEDSQQENVSSMSEQVEAV